MSLKISIPGEKNIVTQPEKKITLTGEITINRIIDIPSEKKVMVFIKELGIINLESLSNENYDTPSEWTNADVVNAVEQYINSLV